MHRSLTILGLAVATLDAPSPSAAASGAGDQTETTVYVGHHFEVRDPDRPVKYVLNDKTRVARITGSLSTNAHLQRVRLQTGWNLISLAITAPDLPGQVQQNKIGNESEPLLRAAYRWRSANGDYVPIQPGERVVSGSVLWLHARTNRVIALRGDPGSLNPPRIPVGGGFVSGAEVEAWPIELPPGVTVWKFDPAAHTWRAGLPGDLAPLSDIPREIAPGEVIHVHTAEAIELSAPRPERNIVYYHPDHVESSSAITDSVGQLLQESAYFPFGATRHQHRVGVIDTHYGFTQKERDRESALHYFEARYLVSSLGRFPSFDPLIQRLEALEGDDLKNVLVQPAKFNPFAYALNNPVRYNDPDGRDARPRLTPVKPEKPEPEITIRIGTPVKGSKEVEAAYYYIDHEQTGGTTMSGAGGRGKAGPANFHVLRYGDSASPGLTSKAHNGSHIRSLTVIVPSKNGEVRIHMKDVLITRVTVTGDSMDSRPLETYTINPGSYEFEAPNAPATRNEEPTREWFFEPRIKQ